MKEFIKFQVQCLVGSAMTVVGMIGGVWLWNEVLEPKAEEWKENRTK